MRELGKSSTELSVGERLEIRRRKRGLSRRVVANLVGRSEEWLRLVETGQRKLDSIEILGRLAEVLRVDDPSELVDYPGVGAPRFEYARHDDLRALRQVVVDHPALRVYGDADYAAGPHADDLTEGLGECSRTWVRSPHRRTELAQRLPALLFGARTQRWRNQDEASGRLLVDAYHQAQLLLSSYNEHGMAATLADRAIGTAAQLHRPELIAAGAWYVADAILNLAYVAECHRYAIAAAARLSKGVPVDAGHATLWGALHLMAARGAAIGGDEGEHRRLVGIADQVAAQLGGESQTVGIYFGPVEVGLTRLEIELLRGTPEGALRLAPDLDIPADYPIGRRVRFHILLARAYVTRQEDVAAALALTRAAAISPNDIRMDQEARRCVYYLNRRDNYLTRPEVADLTRLAQLS